MLRFTPGDGGRQSILLRNAELIARDGWLPRFGMVDKDSAEINALYRGKRAASSFGEEN